MQQPRGDLWAAAGFSSTAAAAAVVTRITSEVNAATKNHLLSNMISNVADRYITPEYLAPLPSSVSHKPKTVNTTSSIHL